MNIEDGVCFVLQQDGHDGAILSEEKYGSNLVTIYNKDEKRCGKSRYLLSIIVDVVKSDEILPSKVVYVCNRNKRKEYLCLISIDVNPDENEIIRIYGNRWNIEVFFRVCKSYLNLNKECNFWSTSVVTKTLL